VRITHPFHPLHGHSFPLLYRGHTGQERWVVLQRPDGSVLRLPTEWTDLRTPDGYGDVARGRSRFRLPDLVRLAESLRLILREGEL
jgi:Family of unknown function (DUF5372)